MGAGNLNNTEDYPVEESGQSEVPQQGAKCLYEAELCHLAREQRSECSGRLVFEEIYG